MDYLLDKLLDIIFWVIEGVIGLLPTYQVQNDSMINSLYTALAGFNQYIPIVEMAECIVAYLSFSVLYMTVKPILKLAQLS